MLSKTKTCLTHHRKLSFTATALLNQKLRKERGLPLNPNASGALTDSPDFSYLDGRIAPLGQGQSKRFVRNQQAKSQIISLSKEIDFAVERYRRLQSEASEQKQAVLDGKLKPKGAALLQKMQ